MESCYWQQQLDILAQHKQTEDVAHMAPFNKINILAKKHFKFHRTPLMNYTYLKVLFYNIKCVICSEKVRYTNNLTITRTSVFASVTLKLHKLLEISPDYKLEHFLHKFEGLISLWWLAAALAFIPFSFNPSPPPHLRTLSAKSLTANLPWELKVPALNKNKYWLVSCIRRWIPWDQQSMKSGDDGSR